MPRIEFYHADDTQSIDKENIQNFNKEFSDGFSLLQITQGKEPQRNTFFFLLYKPKMWEISFKTKGFNLKSIMKTEIKSTSDD